MSPLLVALVVASIALIGLGMQVSARQIQRFPVDNRNPGPLIDSTTDRRFVVRPAELEQLHSVVEESLASEAVAASKLRPLLRRLDAEAPLKRTKTGDQKSAGRRSRTRLLEQELADLEQRWGLTGDDRM